jgi:hypothetical protein
MRNSVMRPHWLEWLGVFRHSRKMALPTAKTPMTETDYEEIRRLAAEMMATGVGLPPLRRLRTILNNQPLPHNDFSAKGNYPLTSCLSPRVNSKTPSLSPDPFPA